jgi:hypothetical protein
MDDEDAEDYWRLLLLGEGLTYQAALEKARAMGYDSIPIGPESWPDES